MRRSLPLPSPNHKVVVAAPRQLSQPLCERPPLRASHAPDGCLAPASVNTGNVYANEFPMTWFENKTPRNSKDDVCCTWTWLRLRLVCWPRRVWRCRWPLEACVCVLQVQRKRCLNYTHSFTHTNTRIHTLSYTGLLCIVCTFTAAACVAVMSRVPCRTLNARRKEIRAKPSKFGLMHTLYFNWLIALKKPLRVGTKSRNGRSTFQTHI